jgi:hypothetical protein
LADFVSGGCQWTPKAEGGISGDQTRNIERLIGHGWTPARQMHQYVFEECFQCICQALGTGDAADPGAGDTNPDDPNRDAKASRDSVRFERGSRMMKRGAPKAGGLLVERLFVQKRLKMVRNANCERTEDFAG